MCIHIYVYIYKYIYIFISIFIYSDNSWYVYVCIVNWKQKQHYTLGFSDSHRSILRLARLRQGFLLWNGWLYHYHSTHRCIDTVIVSNIYIYIHDLVIYVCNIIKSYIYIYIHIYIYIYIIHEFVCIHLYIYRYTYNCL